MTKAFLFLLVSLPFIFYLQNPAFASPTDHFDAGVEAFNQGEYERALEHFVKAELSGFSSARLDYNLGSVYYRLKEYNSSKHYFEKLLGNPALGFQAQYSLALIEYKTGNRDEAIRLFKKCIQLTDQPELIALVTKQIDSLEDRKPVEGETKDWFVYLSPGFGYDSNITYTPSSSASNRSDNFLQAIVYAETNLYSSGINSIDLSLTHYSKDYRDSNDFNLSITILKSSYHDRFENWKMAYGLEQGRSTFSGDDYLSTTALSVNAKNKLPDNEEIRLDVKYEDISSLSRQFDFIAGNRTALKSEYRIRTAIRETDYIYQLELNDRENTAKQNFSPTRHLFGFQYRKKFLDNLKAGFKLDYRDSDYESTPTQNRRDKRSRVSLKASYQISAQWSTNLEAVFTRNRSSEDNSDYRNKTLTISVNALF